VTNIIDKLQTRIWNWLAQHTFHSDVRFLDDVRFLGGLSFEGPDAVRTALTADRVYYVRTDGNDANDGLMDSATGAFRTIQKAIDAYQLLDCNGHNVTINVRPGTYADPIVIRMRMGPGNLYIIGDEATPSNVLISTSAGTAAFYATGHPPGSIVIIGGFTITTTTGDGIRSANGSTVYFRNIEFGACAGHHVIAWRHGTVGVYGSYAIRGNAGMHMLAQEYGEIVAAAAGVTVTITGPPAFSCFAMARRLGIIYIPSTYVTYVGAATGTRYVADENGVVNTNAGGAAYFPGDLAGAATTGGQYV
jgi:hypothetical protein